MQRSKHDGSCSTEVRRTSANNQIPEEEPGFVRNRFIFQSLLCCLSLCRVKTVSRFPEFASGQRHSAPGPGLSEVVTHQPHVVHRCQVSKHTHTHTLTSHPEVLGLVRLHQEGGAFCLELPFNVQQSHRNPL